MKGGGRDRVGVPARAVFSGEPTAATRSPDLEGNKNAKKPNPRVFSYGHDRDVSQSGEGNDYLLL